MKMYKLYLFGKNKLFKINRSITGKGTRLTLKLIKKIIPKLKISNFKSTTKVFDWKIPYEWNVKNAYVIDKNKRKIIDFKKNNLHLVGYSEPVNKIVSKSNLFSRIHTLEKQKNLIPYVTSYYKKYWGFCLSHNEKKRLNNKYKNTDKFFVKVESNFKKDGKLTYGEVLIPGRSKKEILISTYVCHPSMANNELSGPLVSIALIKFFQKRNNKLSLRFLFVPETIGSIAYISRNFKSLKKNVIGGYVLTCIGDNRNYSYLKTKYENSLSDYSARAAFKKLKIKPKYFSFLDRGSDERQFNSPGVDLNIGSIMRSKYLTYPEYHTSKDDFKLVTPTGLQGGFRAAREAIIQMQNLYNSDFKTKKKNVIDGYKPKTNFFCEPNMGKRNLYPKISQKVANYQEVFNLMNFIQFSDGSNTLKQIATLAKINYKKTIKIFKILKEKKIIS